MWIFQLLLTEKRVQHLAQLGDEVEVRQRYDALQTLSQPALHDPLTDHVDTQRHVFLVELRQSFELGLSSGPGVEPPLPEGVVAEVLRVDVDHPAARYRGRGGVLEVEHLEQHGAVLLKPDPLAVRQRQ